MPPPDPPPVRPAPTTPAARRATVAFAAFAAGQWVALWAWGHSVLPAATVWFGAALLALALGALRRQGPGAGVLTAALALLAGGHFTARVLERPPSSLAALLPSPREPGGGSIVTIDGVVVEAPEHVRPSGALADYVPMGSSIGMTVRVRAVVADGGIIPSSGRARVLVRGGGPDLSVGDRVELTGMARVIEGPVNPGEPDARLWAAQDRRATTIAVGSPDLIRTLPPADGIASGLERRWLAARAWLRGRAMAVLDGVDGSSGRAMLAALLLGERDPAIDQVQSVFARQGLAHVLAISGFHLAVMAGAALWTVRLTGDRGRLEPLLVAGLVVLYVSVLPARAPILRAAAMVLAWLAAESFGRRYDKRALLAWVAIGVLVVRPMDLFSLGYQLTFGITAVLVWFGERVHARLFPGPLGFERREPPGVFERRWWRLRATQLVSASLLCWLAATPLVARAVGMVSPSAVLATLAVVPLVTALLWAGYAALALGVLVPPVGAAASGVLGWLAAVIVAVVGFFDGVPLTTLYAPRLSGALTAAMTAIALVWLVRGGVRSPGLWSATLVAAGWLGGEAYNAGRLGPDTPLRIDTLAVGDGVCHLVRSGRDAMLWDCGSLDPAVGVRTIPRAVRALGSWRVREVVITHPNFDHYSGLPDAMERLGVGRVYFSRAFLERADHEPDGAAAALLTAIRSHGVETCELAAGATLRLGRATVRVLSPPPGRPFAADNDNSLVARVSVDSAGGTRRVMLCGDIQRDAIAALLTPGADLAADVMELPHHGSALPISMALVAAVDPGVVLQSTGPSRALDIRWNETRLGRRWWTTATDGAAWAAFRADGSIETGSARRPPG